MKRSICVVLAFVIMVCGLGTCALAADNGDTVVFDIVNTRATSSFTITLGAGLSAEADEEFLLSAGETVRLRVIYTPEVANVNIGLVAPDGDYYYLNVSGGDVNRTIEVPDTGYYTLRIENNEDYTVRLTGYVYY